MDIRWTKQFGVIIITFLSVLSIATTPARADSAPAAGYPGAQWVPAGPMSDKLQFQIYSNQASELLDTQAGHVDVVDSRIPYSYLCSNCGGPNLPNNPGFLVTGSAANMYDIFSIDFNMTNNFWGIQFGGNSQNVRAALQLRQGIAHLVDKQQLVTTFLQGFGQPVDCFAPPLQGVPCMQSSPNGNIPAWNVNSWDPNYATISAYHIGGDNINGGDNGFVPVGSPDFCAAADYFVKAFQLVNVIVTKNSNCVLSNAPRSSIDLWFETSQINPTVGLVADGLEKEIDTLMNHPSNPLCYSCDPGAVVVCPGNSASDAILGSDAHLFSLDDLTSATTVTKFENWSEQLYKLVWGGAYGGATSCLGNQWNISIMGWNLDSSFDQFYNIYSSKRSFNDYYNPTFDHWSSMIEYNSTATGAMQSAQAAEYILGSSDVNIPLWSDQSRFAYSNGWTGVIQQTGVGTSNYWTALNAWDANPGQQGPTIRWGFRESTLTLNPFQSLTYWDSFVVREIYDSLITSVPYCSTLVPCGSMISWMLNSYTFVNNAQDPNCPATVGSSGIYSCLKISLRGDIQFHDGVQVTASDVKFSILNFSPNDVVDVVYSPSILPTSLGGTAAFNQPEIFYIALGQPSPFILNAIAQVPIVPQHIWHTAGYNGPCKNLTDPQCQVDPSYLDGGRSGTCSDPVIIASSCTSDSGLTIPKPSAVGSGPFVCANGPFGQSGTMVGEGCSSSGNSFTGAGNSIILWRFGSGLTPANLAYFRNSANYKQWQWANYDGASTVDGLDISTASGCLSANPPLSGACLHYDSPATSLSCNTNIGPCLGHNSGGDSDGLVTNAELNQIRRWFAISWTDPIAYATLANVPPNGNGAQPVCSPSTNGADAGACTGLYDDGSIYQSPPPPP